MNSIKRIIYQFGVPALGHLFVSKNKYCNVIYYHDIVREGGHSYMQTNLLLFQQQMQYLVKQGYETLRFDDFEDADLFRFRNKRVCIAFDDGWLSNHAEIFDWMKERGLKYNVFLAVGLIGNDERYLTWDMIREMHESGLCGFGAHTYSHTDLSYIDDAIFEEEVLKADTLFENELGYAPKDFCYPYGRFTKESIQQLITKSSYSRIYLSTMSYSYPVGKVVVMGRNGISNDDSFCVFENKVKGYYNIFTSLVQ